MAVEPVFDDSGEAWLDKPFAEEWSVGCDFRVAEYPDGGMGVFDKDNPLSIFQVVGDSYDPSVLASLGNFDFLDISNPTESYRYLDGKSILDLRVAWTGLDDLRVLDRVTRLERLEIDHRDVSDLSPLSGHAGLKVLRLTGLPVRDWSVLTELKQLEEVSVSAEQRPALEALGELPFTVLYE